MKAGQLALDWSATAGAKHRVQFSDPERNDGWHHLGEVIKATARPVRTVEADVTRLCRLYRVVAAE